MISLTAGSSPRSDVKFVSILDSDTVELFNRDTLYPSRASWLGFMHEKRLEYQRMRHRFTWTLIYLIGAFAFLSFLFLLLAAHHYNQADENDVYLAKLDEESLCEELAYKEQCHSVPPEARVDCNPDPPITREQCLERGCCWNIPTAGNYTLYMERERQLPPLDVPYCYYGGNYSGYSINDELHQGEGGHQSVMLHRIRPSGFKDILQVRLDIFEISSSVVRIKLTDAKNTRYEVPLPKLNLPSKDSTEEKLYTVKVFRNNATLHVTRRNSNQAIFSVNLAQLVYSDQFIQITSQLPNEFLYGIGEHRESFRKVTNWKRYTLFNRDQYPLPDMALYGSHAFHLMVEEDNQSSGVFLFNSNAMDIITQPAPAITYRTIGGILDFFIFLGPKPENVVSQYQNLIGLPQMPPYWALGFHLSRFGYRNMSNLQKVFERTRDEKIPYDVQWTDIDMMESNNDFTYDKVNFKNLPTFITSVLHPMGMRFVPMFDCGISAGENPPDSYLPYKEGLDMNVFVKNASGGVFVGKVWNRKSTVWPDFTHPNATLYWTRQFARYHKDIPFDGAWIDMNEPSNFFDGESHGCPADPLEDPVYTPGMTDDQLTLRRKTLCMTAKQHVGRHYDVHNLYGMSEAIITNSALKTVLKKRPLIISRSTAPGHGHYASHWDGDIISDWPSMKWSISSILNFNLFGIPLVGADICGFNGNTTEELCARWHQLGAFYTFARNHNTDDGIDQDPAALGSHVVNAAKNALLTRYALLPYLYTLFYRAHQRGGTVIRPLFFEFPNDTTAYKIETQFLWGTAVMVAPALEPNQKKVLAYFPKGNWFFVGDSRQITSRGEFLPQDASFNYPNVYYRAGSIVPIQQPKTTTEATRSGNFTLVVTLDSDVSNANGELYWDSGDGLDTEEMGLYNLYLFNATNRVLEIKSQYLGYATNQSFTMIQLWGVCRDPSLILVDGHPHAHFAFNPHYCKVEITDLKLALFSSDKHVLHRVEWKA